MGGNVPKCPPLVRKKGNSWSRMFLSHCWLHSSSYCQECVSVGVWLCECGAFRSLWSASLPPGEMVIVPQVHTNVAAARDYCSVRWRMACDWQ